MEQNVISDFKGLGQCERQIPQRGNRIFLSTAVFKNIAMFFPIFCFVPLLTLAVDDTRLWLPAKYNRMFLDLKEAALAAEQLDRCVTVLRGTIDLEKSKPKHPIYRILCRQQNGRSYNEMVDGLTYEPLTTKIVIPVPPTPEELEARRLAEARHLEEARERRKRALWELCESDLNNKVRLMQDVSWVGQQPPEPDVFEDEEVVFIVDFNAKDVYGSPLQYRAECQIMPDNDLSTTIFSRGDN